MLPFSFYLEILIALAMASILGLMWLRGRRDDLASDRGWWLIFSGFVLLFFGALVDISDHFPSLGRFIILGRTSYQSLAEKLVGFFGGFVLLALGFARWLPHVAERRSLEVRLREANRELQERVEKGTQEIQMSRLRSELAQRRHQRAESLLENMISGAAVALFATDAEGGVTHVAGRALGALGLDAGSIGRPLARMWPTLADSLARTLGNGEVTTAEMSLNELTFQLHLAPLDDADGEREGAVVVATDITELHRVQTELLHAKEAAEAANRAKSAFLATMSHELRTPLNSVIGFAKVLEKNRSGGLNQADLDYAERIRENGLHLLMLINDILDLSKIEAGQLQFLAAPTDVGAVIHEVADQLRPSCRPGVELVVEVPADRGHLDTDAGRLRQVIGNLLSNAIKFTHEGRISIHLEAHQGRPMRLAVSDSGIGIPADRLDVVFEAFQQVDDSTSRLYGGSGLGLSICRSLCHLLGFSIDVESREGEGTTFAVLFEPAGVPTHSDKLIERPTEKAQKSAAQSE